MVLEVVNVALVQLKDQEIEGDEISTKMIKTIENKDYYVPVVIRVGAVDYQVGEMIRVRRGRDTIFGDLTLDIIGSLELEVTRSETGKVTKVKPNKFVYVRERME